MKCSSTLVHLGGAALVSSLIIGCGTDGSSKSIVNSQETASPVSYRELNVETFKHSLDELMVDANSFWVNSMFQTNNLGSDECFLKIAQDTRFTADSSRVELKGSWDFMPCLEAMNEEGQKNEWEIAMVQFDLELSCEGLDHSAFNQVALTEGTAQLRDQCKNAPSVSMRQKVSSRTKGKLTVTYSGTEFVNQMDFESSQSFGSLDGSVCKSTRTSDNHYQIDGCRNLETEVNTTQSTYKMPNGEVKVEPTKTEMELTQQDYSNFIARAVVEGEIGEEEIKGVPVSGKVDFVRNNWIGSIQITEGSKPTYQANGVIAGENISLEGHIE